MDRREVDELVHTIYGDLHRRATRIAGADGGASPSSLVHETILRLYRQAPEQWRDETHFRATAALALKQVLIDGVRRRQATKRGPEADRVSPSFAGVMALQEELAQLVQVLTALEAASPRTAEVMAMKVFGELENEEIAADLGISRSTVDREWRAARALLGAWRGLG